MSKEFSKINIELSDGKKYTFQFSIGTAVDAERGGFKASEGFFETPLTATNILAFYALKKNHPTITKAKVEEILQFLRDGNVDMMDFVGKLAIMYQEILSPNLEEGKEKIVLEME